MILLGLPLRPEIGFPLIRLAAASPAIICAAHSTTLFNSTRSASPLKACRIHPSAVHARTCVRVLTFTIPVRRPCERPILLARQSAKGKSRPTWLVWAEGAFDKDENLTFTFSKKVSRKGLPSTEFAMGYHGEVGVGGSKDVYAVRMWCQLVSQARTTRQDADHNPDARLHHGNTHAVERLAALSQPSPQSVSRQERDTITESKLA